MTRCTLLLLAIVLGLMSTAQVQDGFESWEYFEVPDSLYDYYDAKQWDNVVQILDSGAVIDSSDALTWSLLGEAYYYLGDSINAVNSFQQSLFISKSFGETTFPYRYLVDSLNVPQWEVNYPDKLPDEPSVSFSEFSCKMAYESGVSYADRGDYSTALIFLKEAYLIADSIYPQYYTLTGSIAWHLYLCYEQLDSFQLALHYLNIDLATDSVNYGTDRWGYANGLKNRAQLKLSLNRADEALLDIDRSIVVFERSTGPGARSWHAEKLKAVVLYRLGQFLNSYLLADKIYTNFQTINHSALTDISLMALKAHSLESLGKSDECIVQVQCMVPKIIASIDSLTTYSFGNDLTLGLESLSVFIEEIHSMVLRFHEQSPSLIGSGLNLTLAIKNAHIRNSNRVSFNKGYECYLQNNPDSVFRNSWRNQDSINLAMIDEYFVLLNEYIDESNKEFWEQSEPLHTIKKNLQNHEASLRRSVKQWCRGEMEVVGWEQIQAQLNEKDVAIEFGVANYSTATHFSGDTVFFAYFIKKVGMPEVIQLSTKKELLNSIHSTLKLSIATTRGLSVSSSKKAVGPTTELFNSLWLPLEEHMEGIDNVYFSTIDILNLIPMASLYNGEQFLVDRYNLVQLNSCSGIVDYENVEIPHSAVLVGGVNYTYDSTGKLPMHRKDPNDYYDAEWWGGAGKWSYLPGTEKEIASIQPILNARNLQIAQLEQNKAKEEALVDLIEKAPGILHLATHGYYFPTAFQDPDLWSSTYESSEDPMERAGLILSGANYAWLNQGNEFEEEDGVLTANELSLLDLSNTKLVVLSACETGVGPIDRYEGVVGLPRALQIAGAKAIIISLWKIPDRESAEFMTEFYSQWAAGKSLNQAFRSAQSEMARKYKDPYLWAGFSLIEG